MGEIYRDRWNRISGQPVEYCVSENFDKDGFVWPAGAVREIGVQPFEEAKLPAVVAETR